MKQRETWRLARIEGARKAANEMQFASPPRIHGSSSVRSFPRDGIAPQSVIGSLARLLERGA